MKITLITPPFTQLNTPYPAIGMLGSAIRDKGYQCEFRDLGIELALELYSQKGMTLLFEAIQQKIENGENLPKAAWQMFSSAERYITLIPALVRYLKNQDLTLAHRIMNTDWLPPSPRLKKADVHQFGRLGLSDAARYLATLVLEDIADLTQLGLDEGFGFSQYQSHLATGPSHFLPIKERLQKNSVIDQWLDELSAGINTNIAILTIPFPGTLYGALRIGQSLKKRGITVWMGGGYVSTELRDMTEPGMWECCDALVYDDGEGPLNALLEHHMGKPDRRHRTKTKTGWHNYDHTKVPFEPLPWYGNLDLSLYLQVLDTLNPAHRLWSDGRWNKLIIAHGCYWKKCAFCDIQLDYIADYVPSQTKVLIDGIKKTIEESNNSGFHFVDEAAPPRALRDLSIGLLNDAIECSWWGNIRFEVAYSSSLCQLLAAGGLIAVTGGLEVASDRLLKLMDKGIEIETAARTAHAFQSAGIMVHAYLMYGFPTQTIQESIDAMEIVRQMFEAELLSSAFWHRFVLTRHSGVYAEPEKYAIEITQNPKDYFSSNDLEHLDPTGGNHDIFDDVLPRALDAWMRGEALDRPVHTWFEISVPKTTENPRRIQRALVGMALTPRARSQVIWLGPTPIWLEEGLLFFTPEGQRTVSGSDAELEWTIELCQTASPDKPLFFHQVQQSFVGADPRFWKIWGRLITLGMIWV